MLARAKSNNPDYIGLKVMKASGNCTLLGKLCSWNLRWSKKCTLYRTPCIPMGIASQPYDLLFQ